MRSNVLKIESHRRHVAAHIEHKRVQRGLRRDEALAHAERAQQLGDRARGQLLTRTHSARDEHITRRWRVAERGTRERVATHLHRAVRLSTAAARSVTSVHSVRSRSNLPLISL